MEKAEKMVHGSRGSRVKQFSMKAADAVIEKMFISLDQIYTFICIVWTNKEKWFILTSLLQDTLFYNFRVSRNKLLKSLSENKCI